MNAYHRITSTHAVAFALLFAAACSDGDITEHLVAGDEYFANEQYREAIIEYRNAVRIDPRHGAARFQLGLAYSATGNAGNALREFVRAADLLEDNPEVQLAAGQMLLAAQRYEEARARAERVLTLDRTSVDAQILLGNASAGMEDFETAIGRLQEAVALAPDRGSTYTNLAALHLASGDVQTAEAAYRRAVAIAPDSASARLALGRFYWATGRTDEAESAFRAAADRAPDDLSVVRTLATFYTALDRTSEAEAHLLRLAEDPEDYAAQLALADFYIRLGREPEARRLLDSLTSVPRVSQEAQLRVAGLEYQEGRTSEAHEMVDDLLEGGSIGARPWIFKVSWLATEGRHDEALEMARQATEAYPEAAATHYALGEAFLLHAAADDAERAFQTSLSLDPNNAATLVQLAQLYLERRDPETALEFSRDAVGLQPGNVVARLTHAQVLIRNDLSDQAEAEIRLVLDTHEDLAEAHVLLGDSLRTQGKLAPARSAFERGAQLAPESAEAFSGLVSLDIQERGYDEAILRVDEFLATQSARPDYLVIAARTYRAAGDPDDAEQALLEAVAIDPGFAQGYRMLAQLYFDQSRLDEALGRFQDLVEREPESVVGHTMSAVIMTLQGRSDESIVGYERVLELDPRSYVAANNLAYTLAEREQELDRALQLAQLARAEAPDSPEAADTLAWVYYRQGLPGLAIPLLEESVASTPTEPMYHYHLGLAHLGAENEAQARAAFRRALELNPGLEMSPDAREFMDGTQ